MKFYDIPATCWPCGKRRKKTRSIRCGGPCKCRIGRCCIKRFTKQREKRAGVDRALGFGRKAGSTKGKSDA